MSRTVWGGIFKVVFMMVCGFFIVSCVHPDYSVSHPPDYDHVIGKNFDTTIFKGRQVFKRVRENEGVDELESRRSDGCILVFGVRRSDAVIEYWRVDSGFGTCLERKTPLVR